MKNIEHETLVSADRDNVGIPIVPQSSLAGPVNSQTLFRGKTQLAILHQDEVYYLRQTRLGKLILTK